MLHAGPHLAPALKRDGAVRRLAGACERNESAHVRHHLVVALLEPFPVARQGTVEIAAAALYGPISDANNSVVDSPAAVLVTPVH